MCVRALILLFLFSRLWSKSRFSPLPLLPSLKRKKKRRLRFLLAKNGRKKEKRDSSCQCRLFIIFSPRQLPSIHLPTKTTRSRLASLVGCHSVTVAPSALLNPCPPIPLQVAALKQKTPKSAAVFLQPQDDACSLLYPKKNLLTPSFFWVALIFRCSRVPLEAQPGAAATN